MNWPLSIILFYFTTGPFVFFVSKAHTEFAERFEYALKATLAKGEFDALLKQHFSKLIDRIDTPITKIIVLNNQEFTGGNSNTLPTLLNNAVTVNRSSGF
ncbi:MAG: hypothetical protein ACI9Y1_002229 [Lentisphaeria bacterium]|jgi:hypothetical protein